MATASIAQPEFSFVHRLAQFFPDATPVRIPARVIGTTISGKPFSENTTIEFSTSREVIFGSHLPLEFAEVLRLESADGSLNSEATVVAIHYFDGATTAVAARFKNEPANGNVKD